MALNTIPLTPCESSLFASTGYDAATKTLALRFKTGTKVALHTGIEPEFAAEFEASPSKGKFWNRRIKGREFTYADLPEAEEAAKA